MAISFQPIKKNDYPFLREILYQAIYVPPGVNSYDRSIINLPEISKYIEGWGREGDFGLILLLDNEPIGAIWGRLFKVSNKGYGFVDKETPEFSMAILPDYRNEGYGTELLSRFIELAKKEGFKNLSLRVDKRNRAIELYKHAGFKIIAEPGDDYTMRIEL